MPNGRLGVVSVALGSGCSSKTTVLSSAKETDFSIVEIVVDMRGVKSGEDGNASCARRGVYRSESLGGACRGGPERFVRFKDKSEVLDSRARSAIWVLPLWVRIDKAALCCRRFDPGTE